MAVSPLDVDALLAELREEYVASLPPQLGELAASLAERRADDARRVAHRLHGTAGTYGLAEVSTHAARIERAIERAVADDDEAWREADAALEDLLRAAR